MRTIQGPVKDDDPNFSKRIHMLYNGTLTEGVTKERDVTFKKLNQMKSTRQLEDEKVALYRADNNKIEKKIRRYRALVQEQIDKVAAKKRGDGEASVRGQSSLGHEI